MADALCRSLRTLGCERAMVVHGADGWTNLQTTDVTYVASLDNGVITRSQVTPEDAGLKRARLADLQGGDGSTMRKRFAGCCPAKLALP